MTSYDHDYDKNTYDHADYPVQYTIQLYLRLYQDEIQEDERDYITPISDYTAGKFIYNEYDRLMGADYSLVVKTDGSEDGTSACFSHNYKTEEIKVETTCHEESGEEDVQYKAVISPHELQQAAQQSLYERGVITDKRRRGLQVWVEFTECGWKLDFTNTHTSTQAEIQEQRIQDELEEEEEERLQAIAEALELTFQE